MKKRILSILMTVLMVITLLPTTALAKDYGGTIIANDVTWQQGDKIILPGVTLDGSRKPLTVTVTGTVDMAAGITVQGNVTIKGGGTLLRTGNTASMLDVKSGASLTLENIRVDGNNIEVEDKYGIKVAASGKLTISEGTVLSRHKNTSNDGSALYVLGSVLMNGGTIENNTSDSYGNIYLRGGASFVLNGGTVRNNTLTDGGQYGGGAFYVRDAELTVNGGTISGQTNIPGWGGAIYCSSYGTVRLNGGTIANNSVTANCKGDAIYYSSKESSGSSLYIGGSANVTDTIYLDSATATKYPYITSAIKNPLKLEVSGYTEGRIIAEGSGHTLTEADMAKITLSVYDSTAKYYAKLEKANNQIVMTATDPSYATRDYTISYDANGGSGSTVDSNAYQLDARATVMDNSFQRYGYTFDGWNTKANGSGTDYDPGDTIIVTGDMTLYAQWEEIDDVTVTAAAKPAAGGSVTGAGTYEAGEEVTLTATPAEGYTFVNWTEDGTEVSDDEEYTFTAAADRALVANFEKIPAEILNNGYPYGKDMTTSSVTLVVYLDDPGSDADCQWQSAEEENGTYTDISGANASTLTLSNPASGTWYRCVVDGEESEAVRVVKASSNDVDGRNWITASGYYHVSNGTMAYRVNGKLFHVAGLYEKGGKEYMLRTSYNSAGWTMYGSTSATPSAAGISSASTVTPEALRVSFNGSEAYDVLFEADLPSGYRAFAIGADTQLGDSTTSGNYSDRAALVATLDGSALCQVSMIGARSAAAAKATDPAFVIAPESSTPADLFWLGAYGSRTVYAYNNASDSTNYTSTAINGQTVTTAVGDVDSGMTMSWLDVPSGGSVKFRFKVGDVAATGAVSGSSIDSPTGDVTLSLTKKVTSITVIVDGIALTEDVHYTLSDADTLQPVISFLKEAGLTRDSEIVVEVVFEGESTPKSIDVVNNILLIPVETPTIDGTYTYNGTEQTVELTGFNSDYMSVIGNTGTNAGDYEAIVTLTDVNYTWADPDFDGKIQWTIATLPVAEPTVNGTYTYNGTEQTVVLDGFDSDYMSVTDNTGTNAGDYEAIVTLTDSNHVWATGSDGKIQWTIATLPVAEPSVVGTYTYNGTEQTVVMDGFDSSFMAITGDTATDAADYEAIVTLMDSNHVWATGSDGKIQWTIAQKEVGLDWTVFTADELIYSGAAKTVTAAATGLVDGDTCDVTVVLNGDNVNVGTFTYTAAALSDPNYKFPANTVSPTYTITPKALTITAEDKEAIAGQVLPELTYTVVGLVDGETLIVEPELTTDADIEKGGIYTIVASNADAGINYAITYVNGTLIIDGTPSAPVVRPGGGSSDTDTDVDTGCLRDTACPMYPYTDLDRSQWYHDGIHYCIENGLMQGIAADLFSPGGTTTRAMIVTILWRLDGSPVVDYAMDFEDVAADQWYTEAIRWAASEGIVEGYGNGKFGTNDAITREQLAAILYRYEQSLGGGFQGLWMYMLDYADVTEVSEWAFEAVCWMNMNGIVTGKPGKLIDPKGFATRAEAAAMLQRYSAVMTDAD